MSASDPFVGTLFGGRWIVERALASGGMGCVYVARHADTGRQVALKLIKNDSADAAATELASRFRRETAALASLSHPNVVTFLDSGVESGHLFLVMELLEGRSLREALGAPMEWQRAFRIGADICRALAAVHKSGVIHRDLKPENVFLQTAEGHDEVVKLIDFGIARLSTGASTATKTGALIGTPGYISPEQLRAQPATAASDVYAVGVMLYEMLTGRSPFAAPDLPAMLVRQLVDPLVSPRELVASLPSDVDALVMRMTAREPAQRVPSAHDALALLSDDAQRARLTPRPVSQASSQAPSQASAGTAPAPAAAPPQSPQTMGPAGRRGAARHDDKPRDLVPSSVREERATPPSVDELALAQSGRGPPSTTTRTSSSRSRRLALAAVVPLVGTLAIVAVVVALVSSVRDERARTIVARDSVEHAAPTPPAPTTPTAPPVAASEPEPMPVKSAKIARATTKASAKKSDAKETKVATAPAAAAVGNVTFGERERERREAQPGPNDIQGQINKALRQSGYAGVPSRPSGGGDVLLRMSGSIMRGIEAVPGTFTLTSRAIEFASGPLAFQGGAEAIKYEDIGEVEHVSRGIGGNKLRVYLKNGKSRLLILSNVERFQSELEDALARSR